MIVLLVLVLPLIVAANQILATVKVGSDPIKPTVKSIKLSQQYLFPTSMRTEETCFGNTLSEVSAGQRLQIAANRPFSLYITTEFTDSYYNLKQYYGDELEDITVTSLILSSEAAAGSEYIASLPLTLKCKYSIHPYFRLKAFLSIKFYADNSEQKFEFNLLLVCAQAKEVASFSEVYIPGYVMFWMLFNLVLQVYHNYPREAQHFAGFIIFFGASLAIKNDLLAYCFGGGALLLVVFKQRKSFAMNTKMFTLYICFTVVVALQAVLTFQGGKQHQLWNSFWIALDNFIVIHIAMFMTLRLLKLSRIRHVFWYFVVVSIFSILYTGNNRFFELQFKNPLDLTCIKISVFFPIMMLPISNYFSTLTNWMHRAICIAILIASILPLHWAISFMALFLFGVLMFEINAKDLTVVRHRC